MSYQTSNSMRYSTMYRTIFRVLKLEEDVVWLILPAWNPRIAIERPIGIFPKELSNNFEKDYQFFGYANIGVENPRDIEIEGKFEYETKEQSKFFRENAKIEYYLGSIKQKRCEHGHLQKCCYECSKLIT